MCMDNSKPILTIAVPAFNMEKYLEQNLNSFCCPSFCGQLEVLVMDNSSTDATPKIAEKYVQLYPEVFKLIRKENNGYGSSINMAVQLATGKYFRIVDADDWVDTEALKCLLPLLKNTSADLVQTDYCLFDISTKQTTHIGVRPQGIEEGRLYTDFSLVLDPFPCLHSTTVKTEVLITNHIKLLHNCFYVDEELSIYLFSLSGSIVYYNANVYRYRIGNSEQSVSACNMAAHYLDRERVIKSYLQTYQELLRRGKIKNHCEEQQIRHINNHFTTLYLYVTPAKKGRALAREWSCYLKSIPELAVYNKSTFKRYLLLIFNVLHMNSFCYLGIKNFLKAVSGKLLLL